MSTGLARARKGRERENGREGKAVGTIPEIGINNDWLASLSPKAVMVKLVTDCEL